MRPIAKTLSLSCKDKVSAIARQSAGDAVRRRRPSIFGAAHERAQRQQMHPNGFTNSDPVLYDVEMKADNKFQDCWMYVLAALIFVVTFVLFVRWMIAIGIFNQPASFRYAALGVFLFCAGVVLINVVGLIPRLLRWLRAKLFEKS